MTTKPEKAPKVSFEVTSGTVHVRGAKRRIEYGVGIHVAPQSVWDAIAKTQALALAAGRVRKIELKPKANPKAPKPEGAPAKG